MEDMDISKSPLYWIRIAGNSIIGGFIGLGTMSHSMGNLEMSCWKRDLLHSKRSKDHDREMVCSLQYQNSAYESGVSIASTGNNTDSQYNYELRKLNSKSSINSGVWSPGWKNSLSTICFWKLRGRKNSRLKSCRISLPRDWLSTQIVTTAPYS